VASTNMKAVITLTADASGVQAGVTKAMQHLNKMQSAISDIRGMALGGLLMDLGRNIFGGIQAEMQRIFDSAHAFSPEAMAGANSLALADQQSQMKLAEAFGPIVGLIDEMKAQALREVTQYLVDNKEAIGQALVYIAQFGIALGELAAQGLVALSTAINHVAEGVQWLLDTIANPGQVLADTSVGLVQDAFGTDAAIWLKGIYDRLGGD